MDGLSSPGRLVTNREAPDLDACFDRRGVEPEFAGVQLGLRLGEVFQPVQPAPGVSG